MKLTIDYETRSTISLPDVGAWNYSKHPGTEVLCQAFAVDDDEPVVWVPDWVRALLDRLLSHDLPLIPTAQALRLMRDADEIEAHNATFEKSIYRHKFLPDGWPEIPPEKWHDSLILARASSLPAGLGAACDVQGVEEQKSKAGHALMIKMCKPRKVVDGVAVWHEEPIQLHDLILYCLQDVRAERALSRSLPPLHPDERRMYLLDQKINERGLHIDAELCRSAARMVSESKAALNTELLALTKGYVQTARQTAKSIEWLEAQGISIPNLQAGTIKTFLLENPRLPSHVARFFEIRKALGLASVGKFQKFVDLLDESDHRARHLLLMCGADTGRWSGKSSIGTSVQPQNLPRGYLRLTEGEIGEIIDALKSGNWGWVDLFHGDRFRASVSCIRSAICAAPGHTLWQADFSAIEGRVLAWLAGEEHILRAYRKDLCAYCMSAAGTMGMDYQTIRTAYETGTPYELSKLRNNLGKPQELGLGFAGGIGAFLTFGTTCGLKPADYEHLFDILAPKFSAEEIESAEALAADFMTKLAEEAPERLDSITFRGAVGCDLAKRAWRANRPATVNLWRGTERAAIDAVLHPGKKYPAGKCTWVMRGGNLFAYLPSGRRLTYNKAYVKDANTKYGMKETLYFWALDAQNRWRLHHTFGGKLAQNLTQAVARDFLRDALLRLEDGGYRTVLHVHDEALAEVPCDTDTDEGFQDFLRLMTILPEWAPDIPIAADGWRGVRYKKD